ncbi:hypothetical protein BCR44DRAFT_1425607 [Catenaria anguillulae PL171]|uniref:Ricin B lectin domain-containing protein n=1 Tax=Catenaria anguillulae PL171 TaxID=765915 RepID=A0A1Y2HYX2_9FUNG|nr:hypothetical protein BCR44DRAFT_1425607 [Catenaria anguillulae PL171]
MYSALLTLKLALALVILAVAQQTSAIATPLNTTRTTTAPVSPSNSSVAAHTRIRSSSAGSAIPFNTTSPDARRRGGIRERRYGTMYGEGCIYNDETWRCLDVEQSRRNWQSADAQMWMCNQNKVAQFFEIWEDKFGAFTLMAPSDHRTPYCLDVAGGNPFEGQVVRWWKCNESRAQSWTFTINGEGIASQMAPNGHGDLCLDMVGGYDGNRNGQPMQLSRCLPGPYNVQVFKMAEWRSGACRV